MGHTIKLDLPDELYEALRQRAAESGRTLEQIAAEYLSAWVYAPAEDPLLKLAGAFESDVTDVAERHDYYIGENLARELDPGSAE